MNGKSGTELIAFLVSAIVGVAVVAVIFSTNGKTSDVISSFGSALSGVLKVAVSPVTGSSS